MILNTIGLIEYTVIALSILGLAVVFIFWKEHRKFNKDKTPFKKL